ncbi:MAG: hypothetical protein OSB10_00110 [Planctomycetota bacterium]|nr:hypothetical protein [Planctomycetota bacterium]
MSSEQRVAGVEHVYGTSASEEAAGKSTGRRVNGGMGVSDGAAGK